MYDERISQQVQLLNRVSAMRRLTDGDEEARSEEIVTASENETRPSRRGPRIIGNIQITPPRQFLTRPRRRLRWRLSPTLPNDRR